jgi:hypothetical protein
MDATAWGYQINEPRLATGARPAECWGVRVATAPKGYSNFSAAGCNILPPTIFLATL